MPRSCILRLGYLAAFSALTLVPAPVIAADPASESAVSFAPPALAKRPAPPADDSWIVDPITQCAAYNPQPAPRESILWTGDCRDGKLEGAGTLTWIVEGELLNTRSGDWHAGRAVGPGIVHRADRVTIEGTWVDGEVEGFVVARYPDGSPLFVGQWVHGSAEGHGTSYYLDGSRYEGEWKAGVRAGHGVFTTALGDRYDGDWVDDEGLGQVREELGDGSTYVGAWAHSRREGRGRWRSATGASDDGPWCAGQRCPLR